MWLAGISLPNTWTGQWNWEERVWVKCSGLAPNPGWVEKRVAGYLLEGKEENLKGYKCLVYTSLVHIFPFCVRYYCFKTIYNFFSPKPNTFFYQKKMAHKYFYFFDTLQLRMMYNLILISLFKR